MASHDRQVAKHPKLLAREILDQIPQRWSVTEQISAVRRVIKLALPPPAPGHILRAATILYASKKIDRTCYRYVFRYIARSKSRFAVITPPTKSCYPLYFTLQHLYHEGRKHGDGKKAVRLVTKLAAFPPSLKQFSGDMYYRHLLAARDTTILYWRESATKSRRGKNSARP